MSLRVKLALALVLLTTAATLAIGTWSYVGTSDRLHAEIDRSLQDGSVTVDHAGPDQDHDKSPGLATGVGREQVLLQTLTPDGDIAMKSSGIALPVDDADRAVAAAITGQGSAPSTLRDVSIEGQPYRMFTMARDNGQGATQTARSLAETLRVLESLRNIVLVAALVVIAAAAAAGWLIATQVTRRLVRLTGAAEEVATTGRLDIDVPVGGRDEAGRLGTAFNEMLSALGRSKDSQQRLVQDAGHELRTPLTSLRTNISVLRRHDDLPAETRARVLSDLDLETRELTTLVDELVELATDQRTDEVAEPMELGPLVERVADRARRRTGRPMALQLGPGPSVLVMGRPLALERAVSNLLDNATKFDVGDGPIDIAVEGGCITVGDRGPGINPDDLPHIFDRFFRAVDARSRPGSGLGLSIVADVAASHDGRAFAANRDGGGACVGFEIPTTVQSTATRSR
jgi:two-component system sensor histidine kinase MprB